MTPTRSARTLQVANRLRRPALASAFNDWQHEHHRRVQIKLRTATNGQRELLEQERRRAEQLERQLASVRKELAESTDDKAAMRGRILSLDVRARFGLLLDSSFGLIGFALV